MTTINIYGKRQFHGNQYIGRTWRMFKTVLSGTWIGIKEMFFNPGKTLLAVLMLGLAFNTFMDIAPSHPAVLIAQEAWADLTAVDGIYQAASTTTVVIKDPVKVLSFAHGPVRLPRAYSYAVRIVQFGFSAIGSLHVHTAVVGL